jgi:hypothetical protein
MKCFISILHRNVLHTYCLFLFLVTFKLGMNTFLGTCLLRLLLLSVRSLGGLNDESLPGVSKKGSVLMGTRFATSMMLFESFFEFITHNIHIDATQNITKKSYVKVLILL